MRMTVEQARAANAEASRRYRARYPDRNNAATRRWRRANKEQHKQLGIDWRKRQPRGYNAALIRKWKYGITDEEFQARRIKQNDCCAICLDVFIKIPCIDHDHKTGKNRDLLCRFCNLVLGNARDRIAVLERAVDYLKKHEDINEET